MGIFTAILSYIGWHICGIALCVLICWTWMRGRAHHAARERGRPQNQFRKDCNKNEMRRFLAISILFPGLFAGIGFYLTGFISPTPWIVSVTKWIGVMFALIFIFLRVFHRRQCCCHIVARTPAHVQGPDCDMRHSGSE